MKAIMLIFVFLLTLTIQKAISCDAVIVGYLVYEMYETVEDIKFKASIKNSNHVRKHKMKCVIVGNDYKCYHLPERLK